MSPRIGITTPSGGASSKKQAAYAAAIRAAGGEAVWLEPADLMKSGNPQEILAGLDGLLLSGGKDINPSYYGEPVLDGASVDIDAERDTAELPLTKAALAAGLPILGICRGIQTLNVAAGGSLYQDLSQIGVDVQLHQQRGRRPEWKAVHRVELVPDSRLAGLMDGASAEVNSFHHQAVHVPAPRLVVTARAPDGVIEGLEDPARPFVVGVQWHPERMRERDSRQRRLFEAFVAAARRVGRSFHAMPGQAI